MFPCFPHERGEQWHWPRYAPPFLLPFCSALRFFAFGMASAGNANADVDTESVRSSEMLWLLPAGERRLGDDSQLSQSDNLRRSTGMEPAVGREVQPAIEFKLESAVGEPST